MKKIKYGIIALAIVLLCGCGAAETTETPSQSPLRTVSPAAVVNPNGIIEQYTLKLCSTQFDGRRAGTMGNMLAEDWLADELSDIGISPYSEFSYKLPFKQKCVDYYDVSMKAVLQDGTEKILDFGVDFMIALGYEDFEMNFSRGDKNLTFVKRGKKIPTGYNAIYLMETDAFTNEYVSGNTRIQIQLSREAFKLLEDGFKTLDITYELNRDEYELNNIAGVIKGTDSEKRVYLTAGFDDMGSAGAALFHGADRSASGTAALLYTARRLNEISSSSPFGFDIVFVFYNGEAKDNEGSAAFVKTEDLDYVNAVNINFSAIGKAGSGPYRLANNRYSNQKLSEALTVRLKQFDISVGGAEENVTSSHSRFLALGIPAVNISSGKSSLTLNTIADTPDTLDFSGLYSLADAVASFVSISGGNDYKDDLKDSKIPEEVITKLGDVSTSALRGDNVHFGSDFTKYDIKGMKWTYTYDEYCNEVQNVSVMQIVGSYELRIVSSSSTFLFQRKHQPVFIYANVTSESPEYLCVTEISGDDFFESFYRTEPLNGMEGYCGVYYATTGSLAGFIKESQNGRFFFSRGSSISLSTDMTVSVTQADETDDELAEQIQLLNLEDFIRSYFTLH